MEIANRIFFVSLFIVLVTVVAGWRAEKADAMGDWLEFRSHWFIVAFLVSALTMVGALGAIAALEMSR